MRSLLAILIGLILIAGCSRKQSNKVTFATNVGAALTEADYKSFGDALVKATHTGNAEAVSDMIDFDALVESGFKGLDVAKADQQAFTKGFKNSIQSHGGLGGQLVQAVKNGGSVDVLHVLYKRDPPCVRVRMILPEEGGVNYVDYVLARRGDGKIRAVDVYNFVSGEYLSQSVRRTAVQVAASRNRGIIARLTGAESDFIKHADDLKQMAEYLRARKGKEALAVYDSLPDSLKHDKTFQLMHVQAASLAGDEQYGKAMEEFRAAFPDDPSTDLISIDHFTMKKQFDKAVTMIDRLDKAVGGDPYLHVLRAGIFIIANRLAEAHKEADKAVAAMPDNTESYDLLLGISLKEKRFDVVAQTLTRIEKRFGIQVRNLAKEPEYAAFVKSPEYRAWKSHHQ